MSGRLEVWKTSHYHSSSFEFTTFQHCKLKFQVESRIQHVCTGRRQNRVPANFSRVGGRPAPQETGFFPARSSCSVGALLPLRYPLQNRVSKLVEPPRD
eukprot:4766839-Prymnesium_polylepis.1